MTKDEAEHQIAAILQRFEISAGRQVQDIEVVDIDLTSIEDRYRRMRRRIEITLEPTPGSQWDTGATEEPSSPA